MAESGDAQDVRYAVKARDGRERRCTGSAGRKLLLGKCVLHNSNLLRSCSDAFSALSPCAHPANEEGALGVMAVVCREDHGWRL